MLTSFQDYIMFLWSEKGGGSLDNIRLPNSATFHVTKQVSCLLAFNIAALFSLSKCSVEHVSYLILCIYCVFILPD